MCPLPSPPSPSAFSLFAQAGWERLVPFVSWKQTRCVASATFTSIPGCHWLMEELRHGRSTWALHHGRSTWDLHHGRSTWALPHGRSTWALHHGRSTWALHHGRSTWALRHGRSTWALRHGRSTWALWTPKDHHVAIQLVRPLRGLFCVRRVDLAIGPQDLSRRR